MTEFIIRRVIHSIFIVWGCATIVFFLLRAIPGDPVTAMLGQEYTPEAAEQLRHRLGLDEPMHVQYVKWFSSLLQGDLGRSIATDEKVDNFYESLFRNLVSHMVENPSTISSAAQLLFVARNIERIGDHATNVAEMVYYAATGLYPADADD